MRMLVRIKSNVHGCRFNGVRYLPGQTVDIPDGNYQSGFMEQVTEPAPTIVEAPVPEPVVESSLDIEEKPKIKVKRKPKVTEE